MKTAALFALLLCMPLSVSAQEKKDGPDWLMRSGYVALGAVSFADLELTGRCLATTGCRESNPIYKPLAGTPGAVGMLNGAISTSVGVASFALHKKGKRKAAKVIVWTWAAVRAGVVVYNVRQLRTVR
jgi:hypothetical protein